MSRGRRTLVNLECSDGSSYCPESFMLLHGTEGLPSFIPHGLLRQVMAHRRSAVPGVPIYRRNPERNGWELVE